MQTAIFFNPQINKYDFGVGHAFRGDRFDHFFKMYREVLGDDSRFRLMMHDESAGDEELGLWHNQDYINMVRASSKAAEDDDELDWPWPGFANLADCGPKRGPSRQSLSVYISRDNVDPSTGHLPEGIEQAARAVVKNSMLTVDAVIKGEAAKAISIGGGLHHAKAGYGEGFCIYNDVVIAAKYAMKVYGLERILILDTDAHAGNGTYEAFYGDSRVLFIDMHQTRIYPGTGWVEEVGQSKGTGYTVNIPLEAGTGDNTYERIFDEIVFPVAREYQPQLILRNGGSDPHFADGLTDLGLTLGGFHMIGSKVRQLSEELCEGKCVDLICSGYNPEVLPKAWISLIAGLTGIKIELEEPVLEATHSNIVQTSSVLDEVKRVLKPYWKCMG